MQKVLAKMAGTETGVPSMQEENGSRSTQNNEWKVCYERMRRDPPADWEKEVAKEEDREKIAALCKRYKIPVRGKIDLLKLKLQAVREGKDPSKVKRPVVTYEEKAVKKREYLSLKRGEEGKKQWAGVEPRIDNAEQGGAVRSDDEDRSVFGGFKDTWLDGGEEWMLMNMNAVRKKRMERSRISHHNFILKNGRNTRSDRGQATIATSAKLQCT